MAEGNIWKCQERMEYTTGIPESTNIMEGDFLEKGALGLFEFMNLMFQGGVHFLVSF